MMVLAVYSVGLLGQNRRITHYTTGGRCCVLICQRHNVYDPVCTDDLRVLEATLLERPNRNASAIGIST